MNRLKIKEVIEQWAVELTDADRFEKLVDVVVELVRMDYIHIDIDGRPFWKSLDESL